MMIIGAAVFLFFLLEGSGIPFVRQYIPYIYFILPGFLFAYSVLVKKHLEIPIRATVWYFAFLAATALSSLLFSVDKGESLTYLLFYLSSYLIFLFFYNQKSFAKTLIVFTAVVGGLIFIGISLLGKNYSFVQHGYQFVVSYFSSHNHLGDLLGIVLLIAGYGFIKTRAKKYIILFLAAFPFFLISFSRTAYVAFFAVLGIYALFFSGGKLARWARVVLTLSIIIVWLFFLVSVKEAQKSPVFGSAHSYLVKNLGLQPKDFFGGRDEYASQILQSFYQRPLFGFGPGNFGLASRQFQSSPWSWTETAHNMFLEILVENGPLATIPFMCFLYLMIRSALRKPSLFSAMLIYLVISFQADYTYRIYSYFVFFVMIAACFYEKDREYSFPSFFGALALIPAVSIVLILGSSIYLQTGNYWKALVMNPFNKAIHPKLIREEQGKGNYKTVIKLTDVYQFIAPYDETQLNFTAALYEAYHKQGKALSVYRTLYEINPFGSFRTAANIYRLTKEVESERNARQFMTEALKNYGKYKYIEAYKKEIVPFCKEHKEIECKKLGWK